MRRFLFLLLLIIGACGIQQKNQLVNKDTSQQSKSETLSPEINVKEAGVIKEKIQRETPPSELPVKKLGLIDIIQEKGIPDDNLWPRSKEQITIYKRENQCIVYYFRENKVVEKKIFTGKEFDQFKASSEYPNNLYKELGAIK